MGQPPTATRHRVTGGGEPCPRGADDYRTIAAQLAAFLAGRPGTTGRTGGRRWSGASSRPTSGAAILDHRVLRVRCTRCGDTTVVGVLVQGAPGSVRAAVCPCCGGPRRIRGAVTEPRAVRRLLAALGLAPEPPPGPPSPPPDPPSIARPPRHPRSRLSVPAGEASWARRWPARADLRPPLPDPARARYGSRSGPRGGRGAGGRGTGAARRKGARETCSGVPTLDQVNSPGGRL